MITLRYILLFCVSTLNEAKMLGAAQAVRLRMHGAEAVALSVEQRADGHIHYSTRVAGAEVRKQLDTRIRRMDVPLVQTEMRRVCPC